MPVTKMGESAELTTYLRQVTAIYPCGFSPTITVTLRSLKRIGGSLPQHMEHRIQYSLQIRKRGEDLHCEIKL